MVVGAVGGAEAAASEAAAAGGGGKARNGVVEELYQTYFKQALDLGRQEALLDAAESVGVGRDAAGRFLARDEDRATVRSEDATARQMGIQGVPCFIVDRRYAVSGAQEPEYFMPLFDLAENFTPAARG